MKTLLLGAGALAAALCAVPLQAAEPEQAMGLERGKYGDPNALVTIPFAFARPDLSALSRSMLDEFASQMDAGAQYEIGGHTDSVGDAAYNQWLSEQRGASVRKYLVDNGVNGEQLNVVGYGETQPTDTNRTRLGRQHNRRVVLTPSR